MQNKMGFVKKLLIQNFDDFQILFETDNYAVVYKPANIPTAPLHENEHGTALALFLKERPQAKKVRGAKKAIECGLLHRLDTPTSGLVLIAKTQTAYDALLNLQEKNKISKTYFAFCDGRCNEKITVPYTIETKFRPFGVGGKKVKPVSLTAPRAAKVKSAVYTTRIIFAQEKKSYLALKVQITKGYRHQIRSHLSSIGFPIIGDSLYNESYNGERLQLYAVALQFPENIYDEHSSPICLMIDAPNYILP